MTGLYRSLYKECAKSSIVWKLYITKEKIAVKRYSPSDTYKIFYTPVAIRQHIFQMCAGAILHTICVRQGTNPAPLFYAILIADLVLPYNNLRFSGYLFKKRNWKTKLKLLYLPISWFSFNNFRKREPPNLISQPTR